VRYSFFFHYNKPASKQRGRPIISLHYRQQCLLVENLVCNVPTKGKVNKRQPFFVMTGKANEVVIDSNVAHIN